MKHTHKLQQGLRGLFCLAAFFSFSQSLSAAPIKAGKAAPGFTLTDSNGKSHSLKDFKGKVVVLEWLNHGCPYVKKHYGSGNMQKLQKSLTKKGVVWLTVISSAKGKQGHSTPEKANQDVKKYKAHPTAVLLDEKGKVGKAYGAMTTPHMFVINQKGLVAYNGAIDSIRSSEQSDVPKAENYVLAAATATLAKKPVKTAMTKPYGCGVKYAN